MVRRIRAGHHGVTQKDDVIQNFIVELLVFCFVAVEQKERINEKWKVVDDRNIKRAICLYLIRCYAEVLIEKSGHLLHAFQRPATTALAERTFDRARVDQNVTPEGGHHTMSMKIPVEVAAIEAALTTLLARIDGEHAKYRDRPARRSESGSLFRDVTTISPVEALIDDPIGQSCRLGICRLGERLNELDEGRTQLMHAVSDRVCKNNDDWAEIIDKRWHGIGDWLA